MLSFDFTSSSCTRLVNLCQNCYCFIYHQLLETKQHSYNTTNRGSGKMSYQKLWLLFLSILLVNGLFSRGSCLIPYHFSLCVLRIIPIATCLFPPQLEKLSNRHYLQPYLYKLDNLFQKFWDAKVSGGMNHSLTRFKTTSNDKANRTL